MTRSSRLRARSRLLDGGADAHVSAATADVSRHRSVDVGIFGVWRRSEQRDRRHDLPGLAVAALNDFEIEPGLLHLGARRGRDDAFDGGDGAVLQRADRKNVGTHWLAVDMHGAGAALRDAAAELRPREPKNVAEHPQQGHIGWRIERLCRSVYDECSHSITSACWTSCLAHRTRSKRD